MRVDAKEKTIGKLTKELTSPISFIIFSAFCFIWNTIITILFKNMGEQSLYIMSAISAILSWLIFLFAIFRLGVFYAKEKEES